MDIPFADPALLEQMRAYTELDTKRQHLDRQRKWAELLRSQESPTYGTPKAQALGSLGGFLGNLAGIIGANKAEGADMEAAKAQAGSLWAPGGYYDQVGQQMKERERLDEEYRRKMMEALLRQQQPQQQQANPAAPPPMLAPNGPGYFGF